MKRFTTIFYIFLFQLILNSCNTYQNDTPLVQKGYIDLSKWDFEKDGLLKLDGDWEFYWNKLYTPEDFFKDSSIHPKLFCKVPGKWSKQPQFLVKLPGEGFATYRIKVKLNKAYDILGIKLHDFSSSYILWINNIEVASNGRVSSVLKEIEPQMLPQIKSFKAHADSLEIIVQVANNFHHEGGMWKSVRIGTLAQIIKSREYFIMLNLFFSGILFILFIYHIWIYLIRKSEKAALWFGVLCFLVILRINFIDERVAYLLFPSFNLNIGYRIEFLSIFIVPLFFLLYYDNLIKKEKSTIEFKIIFTVTLAESIILLFTPTTFYTSISIAFQVTLFIEFCFFFINTFKFSACKKQIAYLLFFGWALVIAIGINDILYLNLKINTGQFAHYAFFVFLIMQSYILSFNLSDAINSVELLSAEINLANINLEQKVIERTKELESEKVKSDNLLLNILPDETAHELIQFGRSTAKTYGMVSVMFTDFKDFTSISQKMPPELLVAEIDFCFSAFDHILEKFGIEKIKTIGDAYMCAGGLPTPTYTHAIDTIKAAFEIRDFMLKRKAEKKAMDEISFEIRIGIHTGPVVAGVVGEKKFAYDIWGDTVNTAARMEQNSEAGKINISGATYELVKGKFNCLPRGKIEAKNKGLVDMYFVEENFG